MNHKDYDILFLGRMFPLEADGDIRRKQKVDMQDAANIFQWNLIKGLQQNNGNPISVISYLPIDSWPRHYSSPIVHGRKMTFDLGRIHYQYVSFCNAMYIKQITNRCICNRSVAAWAKNTCGKQKVLVLYSCKNTLMRAARKAKQIDPSIKVVQIIADITEFAANDTPGKLKKAFIQAQVRENTRLEKYIDGYVLLTEHMRTRLGLDKPYIVMEGIVPHRPDNHEPPRSKDPDTKTILYTGSMNRKYGILELLEAFSQIGESNYRLILCGLGNAEPVIEQYAQKDSRISFQGKVSHDRVLQLQQEATVLVNPRQNKEEFTKYSFPSKTMEYLASGVPLVAYKLDGIPREYDSYIHYVPDNSPVALAETIRAVAESPLDQRIQWGKAAQSYVLNHKTAQVQTMRILDLIDSLFSDK